MRIEMGLPPVPRALAEGRQVVREILGGKLDEDRLEDVILLTNELVTNAIRHGNLRPSERIRVIVEDGGAPYRIEVEQPGGGFDPSKRDRQPAVGTGLGLRFVAELSDRWAVDVEGETTRVWFEVDG